jgi:hypothetical protein
MFGEDVSLSDFEEDNEDIALYEHNRHSKKRCFSKRRPGQSKYLIYPEDSFKSGWDLYIAAILIFTCLVTPYRIALIEEDSPNWKALN